MNSLVTFIGAIGFALAKSSNPSTKTATTTDAATGEKVEDAEQNEKNSAINIYSGIFALVCVAFGLSM